MTDHIIVIATPDKTVWTDNIHFSFISQNLFLKSRIFVILEGDTKGAACSALLSANHIKGDKPLLIANGDQYLDVDISSIMQTFMNKDIDGGIITFESIHPKWSFVKLDTDGFVVEAAEKRPISKYATAGLYFFKKGNYFIEAAQEMIKKGVRIMGQFFICPVYNEMILKGMIV